MHLRVTLPKRPHRPVVTAIDQGDQVVISKQEFVHLTQYIIVLEAYADALEIALEE
ncbi:hypothetical protein PVA44_07430 (plasmid) [Entomospira nematocerorum]|uniref:Uncharacterized protein n=1 Tax=Entomospira nematocerorum TaxID=2719987 RepID=A0A968GES5_9SPIO|nr:hypothetical protein [Entomospira nematocera]NIZ47742.1 hypothetical protein [Entomospira nematocera]WDI34697.1 hypothetical protein PVA44_07430 [Entomospira nematocera]